MQRLSYLTETVLSNKITRNIILSFKDLDYFLDVIISPLSFWTEPSSADSI